MTKFATLTVRVNPRWRVLHQGRVYESGEEVDLPILQAAEWACWGSVSRISGKRIKGWAL
jgi:hypothetical protein